MKKILLLLGTLSSFSFLLYTNWPIEPPERLLYSIVDLGVEVRPIAVNNLGSILLETREGYAIRRPDGATELLSIPGRIPHRFVALNDHDEVAGATDPEGDEKGRAFVWSEAAGVAYLPEFARGEEGEPRRIVGAFSISNEGEVGVTLEDEFGFARGFLRGDGLTLAPSSRTVPKRTPTGTLLLRRQILFAGGGVEQLDRETRRPIAHNRFDSFLLYHTGLNDHGALIGFAFEGEPEYGRARGSTPSGPNSTRGDVPSALGAGFPFIRLHGQILNLDLCIPPDSGWAIEWPSDLNNRGEIVGVGRQDGLRKGFLFRPIEVPRSHPN